MSAIVKSKDSEQRWLNAAHSILTERGFDAVTVLKLAKKADLTRTGFYWHFKDASELLGTVVDKWEHKNTGNIVVSTQAYAQTINEAVLNLFDCWFDPNLFDGSLDVAIRNWAKTDKDIKRRIDKADALRLDAIKRMFEKFDYPAEDAKVRSLTIIYTQIGYISMEVHENWELRVERAANYCEVFTGRKLNDDEFERFKARHKTRKPLLRLG